MTSDSAFTGNVSERDAGTVVSKLDESFASVDETRPTVEVDQSVGSDSEPMTAEARRQYVNLKRVRYQASNSRTERGQMLREHDFGLESDFVEIENKQFGELITASTKLRFVQH